MGTQSILVLAITVFSFGFVPIGFGTTASFQGLGRPGTGPNDWSTAYGVSADGSVVAGRANYKPFRWTAEGGLVLLESLLEGYSSGAHAVSGDGQTVVGSSVVVNGCEAFRWTAESGTVGLGYLSGSYLDSRAFGVSADGSVVVGWGKGASGYYKAFHWTTSGGMQELPTGGLVSYAEGVSGDGAVVVGRSDSEAFRWAESGGIVGLGDLPGGVFWSGATAVSANGSVVVGYSSSASSGWGNEAFRWTAEDSMVGLGDLPGGDFYSVAEAVSGDGSVVVGRSVVDGSVSPVGTWTEEAFMWDPDNAMRNLKDVLENDFGLDLTGWMLHRATGISDDGSTIVGCGTNPNGYSEGWIATIPKPATTYYVDAAEGSDNNDGLSPETPFATIQKAIDSAFNGDTVLVADGTYTGPGNRDIDFRGKAITVCSESGPENCIIDCEVLGRGFYFHNGEEVNSIVEGFTVTNGHAFKGGGIQCINSSPTITNCTINGNNAADGDGGGISCWESNPTITNCIISGNSAGFGGGGIYCRESSPTITNCAITDNVGSMGGGIYCYGSSPTITNCNISGNSANGYGGGGISCEWESNPTITNCTINGNSAYKGGGIYCDRSSPTITNCTISGNNAADGDGGGTYCEGDSSLTITNCIIWDNSHQQVYGSASVTYSDVQGGWEGIGNIHAFPQFALANDYHLMPGSPCIDVGTNTPTGSLPPTDRDGVPRPLDGDGDANAVADMGAYEFNPNSPSIAFSAIRFSYIQGGSELASQALLIRNCGGATLNWQIVEDCNWLEVAPANGVSTGEINEVTLTADSNGLPVGDYSCVLTVRDANAINSPRTVIVDLRVCAQVLYVPSQAPTIQYAIDYVLEGGTVIVEDGTYTGDGNRDIDFLGKTITVRSENGPDNCIIDCQGTKDDQHGGFYFRKDEDMSSILDGFTIINGYAWQGGGICCYNSNPTITNCIIVSNTAAGQGGGISCVFAASPTITNCAIIGNSSKGSFSFGGGILGYSPFISDCIIAGNSAERGGGIGCGGGSTTITNCTITGNLANEYGGGILISGDHTTIVNCTFAGNSALNGNALACDSYEQFYPSDLFIMNSILWDGGNEIWNNDGSMIAITYSNVKDGWPGEGNIDADPCFVELGYWDTNGTPTNANDDSWVDGDYHLLPISPCIDAGADAGVYDDIEGNVRPFDYPGVDNNGELPEFDMGAYEAIVSCFGINEVKIKTDAGKKGDDIKIKGTFNPGVPIDLMIDDVMYTIDDGPGHVFSFLIPAGSFELEGKGDKDKYKFHSPKGSVPDIKAKFDFDKCKFEFNAKKVGGIDEITSTSLEIILQAGANFAQEIVELEVKGKKGEHLEYKRKPKFECCPKCKGIALMEVTSDQGVFVFEPEPGKEKLKANTVVDDGVNGPVKIHTSCSKPIDVGDVFGPYTITGLIKIFDD